MNYSSLLSSGFRTISQGINPRDDRAAHAQRRAADPTLRAVQQHPAIGPPSPSKRGIFNNSFLSPRARRTRSSFTSSPLAGIKTPVKQAELASRMHNMMLSPSARKSQAGRSHLSNEIIQNGPGGAPMKAKPLSRCVGPFVLFPRLCIDAMGEI